MPYVYDAAKDDATYVQEEPSFDFSELAVADSESKAAELDLNAFDRE